ncbi:uncharacterized protein BX664DRAFT_311105 [Halteromyces radiatus]|uniref:uncharacterized protein n=1 Tax=Halteromyces radiatus TaxID=101107 RepID=UPI00221ED22F|nr:uncharacterized protein BX664DRAFT_311105 [Halteromyces radiatus]KAI8100213.1 hypothetical protein BX664DRAFT_311105 [Halteromyces radiatus]
MDITSTTNARRLVIIVLIRSTLSVMPALIADLLETKKKKKKKKKSDYGILIIILLFSLVEGIGFVGKETSPFILFIDSFTPEQFNDILDGFLDRNNDTLRRARFLQSDNHFAFFLVEKIQCQL